MSDPMAQSDVSTKATEEPKKDPNDLRLPLFDLVDPHKVNHDQYKDLEILVGGLGMVKTAKIDESTQTLCVVVNTTGIHPEKIGIKLEILVGQIRDHINQHAGAVPIQQAGGQHRGVSSPSTMGRGGR